MAIDHYMFRLARKKNDPYMAEVKSRFHQHRCNAISVLNESVANKLTRSSDITMAGVIVFMYADVRLCAPSQYPQTNPSPLAHGVYDDDQLAVPLERIHDNGRHAGWFETALPIRAASTDATPLLQDVSSILIFIAYSSSPYLLLN